MGLLSDLPLPPRGKTGWPWTTESVADFSPIEQDKFWPKISIITPSFNQGLFIEETIRSVLLQNHPNLEFIIFDGGSSDDSVEIIKKYDRWLTFWRTERDDGQGNAINKGLQICTGDIIAWLNSDDVFEQNTLNFVTKNMTLDKACWLIGSCRIIKANGDYISIREPPHEISQSTFLCWTSHWFPQPSTFWNRKALACTGMLNTSFQFIMDVDLWWRMSEHAEPIIVKNVLSRYRLHSNAKSVIDHEKSNSELISWIYSNFILNTDNSYINFTKIFLKLIELQSAIDRIKSHFVIGSALKLWRRHINQYFNKI
ncbi:hypothetical protein A1353_21765 [Methylomonas methanica]|uniref:Glycosyltransferase 2-like domain-containing protein n=1 Tax=Methylomonas methanica TaxID=421 RepID=A0A177M0I1_METMH|nr:glycosyltransferase family 2 protein [Methylomonas methanica]OAH98854.1 hypothetical protein A1353_21765 [Methylomonas methanica]